MYEYTGQVVKIVDGDTMHVRLMLKSIHEDIGFRFRVDLDVPFEVTLRLLGINAPEKNTLEGKGALAWLSERLPQSSFIKVKTVKSSRGDKADKYGGRYDATVWPLNDEMQLEIESINDELVRVGHAKTWDGKGVRPT